MRDAIAILSVISAFHLQTSLKNSVLAIFEKSETFLESLIENWQDGSICSDELAEYDHPYREMFMFHDLSEKIEVFQRPLKDQRYNHSV